MGLGCRTRTDGAIFGSVFRSQCRPKEKPMKPLRITDDIVPVGAFKAHASQLIRRLKAENRPIVITQNGRPAAVLVSPEEFDRLNAREHFVSAVEEGLADS